MGKAILRGLLAAVVVGGAGWLAAAEMRTWTDQNGGHPTRAILLRVEGTRAILRREDGHQIQIERDKLSRADQQYLADHRNPSPSPPEPGEEAQSKNPFEAEGQATAPPEDSSPPAKTENLFYPQGQLANIDWSAVHQVSLTPTGEWTFSDPPVPPAEALPAAKPLLVPPVRDIFFNKLVGVVANPVSQRVLLGYIRDFNPPFLATRLVLCFLKEGRFAQAAGPGCMFPLALSDSGELALMCSAEGHFGQEGRRDRLEVWALTAKGIVPQSQWFPYDRAEEQKYMVRWGSFLGEGQLATLGANGILAVWQYLPLKPLYYVRADAGGTPALSPNRKYLVFAADQQVCVLDLNARAVLASKTLAHLEDGACSFRADGQQLACAGKQQLSVLNFADGELLSTLTINETAVDRTAFNGMAFNGMVFRRTAVPSNQGPMIWTDERHLLLDHSLLYNVAEKKRLWQYDGALEVVPCAGRCWYLAEAYRRGHVLYPTQLPHPGLKAVQEKLAGYPKLFPLRPGAKVRLDLEVILDEQQHDEIRASLTKRLEANGALVAEKSDVELVVRAEKGSNEPLSLQVTGEPLPRIYHVPEIKVSLLLLQEGKPFWGETRSSKVPQPGGSSVVQLPDVESAEQYLRNAQRPDFAWLKNVELPRYASAFGSKTAIDAIDHSRLTAEGIQEYPVVPPEKDPRSGPVPNPAGGPRSAPAENKPRWK